MKVRILVSAALCVLLGGFITRAAPALAAEQAAVVESERSVPIVGEVDVVVVGGTSGAVAAASEAARRGAKVFLFTSHAYLGDDLCATRRLWIEPGETADTPLGKQIFGDGKPTGPARPMHVKRTLDQALLKANVRFLFGCFATDALRDADGHLAGVVMANRAGRQAVVAKVVIDATEHAAVARLAGAARRPFPLGPGTFQRVVVGGKPRAGDGLAVRRLPFDWFGEKNKAPGEAFLYALTLPMKDGTYASFAGAEQAARDLTFHPHQVDASERLFHVPRDTVVCRSEPPDTWPGVEQVDLGVFRPRGMTRLYVLGGCAALAPEAARQFLRPTVLIRTGVRVGAAAAEEAATLPEPSGIQVAGRRGKPVAAGDVREALVGVRPTQRGLPTVPSPPRSVPVLGRYDVVVIGGGTCGAPAGIAAARHGAKTLVVEYQHCLGGVGTVGLIGKYWHGVRTGFTSEIDAGVKRLGAKVGVIGKAEWWRRELRRAGADVWLGALGCGAFVEDGRVCGAVVATPHGRGVVLARVVIDATGNADVAAAAGAECAATGGSSISLQLAGLPAWNPGDSYVNTCYMFTDDSDMVDLWHLLVYAKDRFAGDYDLGTLVDTRERRRVVGEFVLTPVDQHLGRTYPDTICVHASNYDMYGFPVHPLYLLAHPPKKEVIRCYLPYRSLLPKGLDGLLVVGIGLSADRDAMPVVRMQPDVQNLGYAAGTAAAMAAGATSSLRDIDLRALQRELVAIGNLPDEVLTHTDSLPLPNEKVEAAVEGDLGSLQNLAVILAHRRTALPLLRRAYSGATEAERRLVCARVLAVLGDNTGADALLEALKGTDWDRGANIVTSGQSGAHYSRVDMLILALGRSGDPRAVAPICDMAKALDARSGLSHVRAVALALEALGDRRAAPVLAELLEKDNMTGHAITTVTEALRRRGEKAKGQGRTARLMNPAVRELILARALYRCGDRAGMGERILRQYETDLQGPFARQAHTILHGE
jgi:flavin-dependent dehydrogenase